MTRTILRWLALPLLLAYLAATHLMKLRNAGRVTAEADPFFRVALAVCAIVDLLYNLVWATIHFRDWPRELLVTQRLERYKYGRAYHLVRRADWSWLTPWRLAIEEIRVAPEADWRLDETQWMEVNVLDPADPTGRHLRAP